MNWFKKTLLTAFFMFLIGSVISGGIFYAFDKLSHIKGYSDDKGDILDLVSTVCSEEKCERVSFGVPEGIFTPDSYAETLNEHTDVFPSNSKAAEKASYVKLDILDTNGFVYFCQCWKEYASVSYGTKTLQNYGCGPTNIAMVVSTLKNKTITPIELAHKAEEWGCFVDGVGTSHAIFSKAANYYGLKLSTFDADKDEIIRRLKKGEYIICSMGKGFFGRSGHFITMRGITSNGQILIADSYTESNNTVKWDLDYLISELRYSTMWAFSS